MNLTTPPNPHKGVTGITRVINAFFYSVDGLKSAFQHESAFRQELVLAAVLLPVAFLLPVTAIEKVLLISSVFLVLIVELFNSAIEAIVDRVSLDIHELSKRAKDIGSAAVLVSIVNCVITWVIITANTFL